MKHPYKADKHNSKTSRWLWMMVLLICAVIQLDAVCSLIPNQIAGMAATPVVWGIGALYIAVKTREKNIEIALYRSGPFSNRDGLTLFFVMACGIALSVSNFLYADLKPLFIRELFTGYPLYTIRNVAYYPLEVFLMLELLICSQKLGEVLTKKHAVPWGAAALFLLWGLPHILWHGFADGMVSAFRAFLYAVPFYTTNKNIKTGYAGMLILWFL